MANELALPDERNIITKHAEDIAELKRRARMAATPEGEATCCDHYCCATAPGESLSIAEVLELCEFEPDPVGGQGMRLKVQGWARFRVDANGQAAVVLNARLNGTMYLMHPRHIMTMAANDEFTVPFGWTIDSPIAAPILTIECQNIGAVALTALQAYAGLDIGPEDGSITCGVAGSG